MVFARFCKNVIKTSSRSYTGANYQKCVSRGTFIDFQHVWKELLCFSFVGQIQLHLITSHSANSFFNSPLHMTSVVHVTQVWTLTSPPHPNPVTWRQLCMWRKLTWTLTSPPHPNPVTWRQLCMWRKLTWTLTCSPHPWRKLTWTLTSPPTPTQWRDVTQVNMLTSPPHPNSDVSCACDAS